MGTKAIPAVDRVLARTVVQPSGCWETDLSKTTKGYARIRVSRTTRTDAHRIVYEAVFGPIPEALVIDHLCRNRGCVNPQHMEAVESRENTLRGEGPSAQNARKTHCPRDHEYTPENTYISPKGKRSCRTCLRARYAK